MSNTMYDVYISRDILWDDKSLCMKVQIAAELPFIPTIGNVLRFPHPNPSHPWGGDVLLRLNKVVWNVGRQFFECTAEECTLTKYDHISPNGKGISPKELADWLRPFGFINLNDLLDDENNGDEDIGDECNEDEEEDEDKDEKEGEKHKSSNNEKVAINPNQEIMCCLGCGRDTRAMSGYCAECYGKWGKALKREHVGRKNNWTPIPEPE